MWTILAIVLAVVSHQVWGMMFYGILPTYKVFLHLAHPKKKASDMKPAPHGYLASTVGGAVNTGILYVAVTALDLRGNLAGSLLVGFLLAAFGFMDTLPHPFFEERPFALTVLHGVYHLVSAMVKGAIFGALL